MKPLLLRWSWCCLFAVLAGFCSSATAQEKETAWSDKDTRLANEYLSLLVDQPEYGRVVDLLWDLYSRRESTKLLLENVHAQAVASPHPSVLLVEAHLVRKSGNLKQAAQLYDAILKTEPNLAPALRSRAEVAVDLGDAAGAVKLMERLVAALPDTDAGKAEVWLRIGDLSLAAGSAEGAAKAWEAALKLKPDDLMLVRTISQHLLRAGFPEKAAAHLDRLASAGDPARRIEALLDLERVHEHADQPAKADKALKDGLALLDFRDPRYADFFQRRVRLHERFGTLDELKNELLAAARREPPSEKALYEMSRYHALTAEPEERIVWLRALVKQSPAAEAYRWELVRALLDHEGAAEAAKILDDKLATPDGQLAALLLLRAEADLRLGKTEEGVARLLALLEQHASDLDLEKQVLAFSKERSLDKVVEQILLARAKREPDKPEGVFELATFYRTRDALPKAEELLRGYAARAPQNQERARRLSDAAAFMAAGGAGAEAVKLQTEAATLAGNKREQLVRLADYMLEGSVSDDAVPQLEKALEDASTIEERTDIDERLFSLLVGTKAEAKAAPVVAMSAEFRLPSFITGEGFGSGDPVVQEGEAIVTPVVREYAENLIEIARQPRATDAQIQRAAWWASRSQLRKEAYEMLQKILLPPPSTPPPVDLMRFILDLALADENRFLSERLLEDLLQRDAANKTQYLLRLAEIAVASQQPDRAVGHLKAALRDQPDSEPLLSALTQCYTLNGKLDKALEIWEPAVKRATGTAAVSLRQRYAELLLRANRLGPYIDTQVSIVEAEADVKRRREHFKRFLDRITFSDAAGGELAENVMQDRLKQVEARLQERSRRHPFDGFYHEALAAIYEKRGDAKKAFQAMRQAYYTSPDAPFSQEQLRDSAVRSGDNKSAIYFQKQIVATAGAGELAAESRRLVQMLESAFLIADADKVRRRLENRFSQDPLALEDLARHYKETGQDEAERRVYEQIIKVKSWDARSALRLALKCLSLADESAAEKHLTDLLSRTQARNSIRTLPPERWPYPLTDERREDAASALTEVAGYIEESRVLEKAQVDRLKTFLTYPRPEFAVLPDDVSLVRLRAIEELARLIFRQGGASCESWITRWKTDTAAPEIERVWALFYARAGEPLHELLRDTVGRSDHLDLQFVYIWMTVRAGGVKQVIDWLNAISDPPEAKEQATEVVQTVLDLLATWPAFKFTESELRILGRAEVLKTSMLLGLLRDLQDREQYREAMALGECLRDRSADLQSGYSYTLAGFAQSAEDWEKQRAYLMDVITGPLDEGSASENAADPFILSVATLHRLSRTPAEKDELIKLAQARLAAAPATSLNEMRHAAIEALFGAEGPARQRLGDLAAGGLLTGRPLKSSGTAVMPQGLLRGEESNHMRGYWEDLRLIGGILSQQGLGRFMAGVDEEVQERLGGAQLGPHTSDTFGQWRMARLIRQMREENYPTRLRLIQEYLAAVDMREEDSVDTLTELGRELEVNGMIRECIEVYKGLPGRAPTNNTYAEFYIRVCEQAWEPTPGLEYVESLFGKDPVYKPQGIGDETLREKHAHYLARQFKLERLRQLGYKPEGFSRVLTGRIPPEVPYLRELALLLERKQDNVGALVIWDRLHDVIMNGTPEHPPSPDVECSLHRVRLHQILGTKERGHAIAVEVPVKPAIDDLNLELLQRRGELAADLHKNDDFSQLMVVAVDRKSVPLVLTLSGLLDRQQRRGDALSFVTQAERSMKGGEERFILRMELLRLLAGDPAWRPALSRPQISSLFRTGAREPKALEKMRDWLSAEAKTSRAKAWEEILRVEARSGPDGPLAALALSCFTSSWERGALPAEFRLAWREAKEGDRVCMDLTAAVFHQQGRDDWAWNVCDALLQVPSGLGARRLPTSALVAGGLGNRVFQDELFNEITKLTMPGGDLTAEWAGAFESSGRPDLARETFELALERTRFTFAPSADLVIAYIQFLQRQKDFEKAEAMLRRHFSSFIPKTADALVSLYRDWGKLGQIDQEMTKYFLPEGVVNEVHFLLSQSTGSK